MVTSGKRLTLDEFLRLPEAEPALEYFAGVVSQKVSPKSYHGALQFELARLIDSSARPRKLARVFTETRATFGGASLVPDLIVLRWERIPIDTQGRMARDFLLPPDVAVEILSPGQSVTALDRRCRWYVGNGVQVALLILPDDESIRVFRPNQNPRTLRDSDVIEFGEVLPGFELMVRELFACLDVT